MSGYGCHTFKWVNADGKHVFVKVNNSRIWSFHFTNAVDVQYHFLSKQGVKQFNHDEALKVCGEDPDFAKRDLFEHIEKGGDARWTMMVQVMQPEQIDKVNFDPFDSTKVWPRSEFPMQEVGQLVLNRNPEVCSQAALRLACADL